MDRPGGVALGPLADLTDIEEERTLVDGPEGTPGVEAGDGGWSGAHGITVPEDAVRPPRPGASTGKVHKFDPDAVWVGAVQEVHPGAVGAEGGPAAAHDGAAEVFDRRSQRFDVVNP